MSLAPAVVMLLTVCLTSLLQMPATAPDVKQRTEGFCSPAVAGVQGNVTINCFGVDPGAVKKLNDELAKKELTIQQKVAEAEEWAKKYHELEARLAVEGDQSEQFKRVDQLIKQGRFEEAGAILDDLLAPQKKEVARLAETEYKRGLLFSLELEPLKALQHLEAAHRYEPTNPDYAGSYGGLLQGQKQFAEAEPVLSGNIKVLRDLAIQQPEKYKPKLAGTLNDLGLLYGETQRFPAAERAFEEAIQIQRQLVGQMRIPMSRAWRCV